MVRAVETPIGFSIALGKLLEGDRVCRAGWNGKGMHLRVIQGHEWDEDDKESDVETGPFIAIKTADNKLIPWVPSQADLFAVDWQVIE
jgi:hypothetical protein